MDLSILVPSYNTKQLTLRCVRSIVETLAKSSLSYEIILSDNASDDGTIALLDKKYPQVKKILNKKNVGYGVANNIGIKMAKGTYVLLLNSDIEALNHSIESLVSFAKSHPRAFVGGKLFNEDGSAQPSCGPMFTPWNVFLMLFAKADYLGVTRSSPEVAQRVAWVSGACLIGTRTAFLEVGLFDEAIFMYMDEIDFLYRAAKKGYSVYFTPESRFIHTGAASSGSRRAPVLNIFRGLLYFYHKHRNASDISLIKYMLVLKAKLAILYGTLANKREMVQTYEQALNLVV